MKKVAEKGDQVKVHYKGLLDDGNVFDSSEGREPLDIQLGEGKLIPGFEKAVLGMQVGEKKTIKIEAQDAYGDHVAELVKAVERKYLPPQIVPEVGQQLQLGEGEEMAIVTIVSVTDEEIKLDANHPLAGKRLNFTIELVEIA